MPGSYAGQRYEPTGGTSVVRAVGGANRAAARASGEPTGDISDRRYEWPAVRASRGPSLWWYEPSAVRASGEPTGDISDRRYEWPAVRAPRGPSLWWYEPSAVRASGGTNQPAISVTGGTSGRGASVRWCEPSAVRAGRREEPTAAQLTAAPAGYVADVRAGHGRPRPRYAERLEIVIARHTRFSLSFRHFVQGRPIGRIGC